MNKKIIVFMLALALVGGSHTAFAEDSVDEHDVPLVDTRGGISAEVRAELGDNATIGERLRLQRENIRATVEARREELRGRIESGREMIKDELEARKGTIKEKKEAVRATVETRLVEKMKNRYDAAISRLNTLTTRVESRMTLLKNQGKDVSTAATEVASAKTSLALAQTHVDAFLALGVSAEFSQYRTEGEAIATALKEAKQHLQKAVQLLKGLSGTASVSATVE
jgi:hypothetical protein